MIEWTLLILLILAILLFILSLFQKKTSKVEQQMENFSITLMQEIYQLKKKIRILEEELLVSHEPLGKSTTSRSSSQQQLLQDVVLLYEAGYSIEDIALETTLTQMEVARLLQPYLVEEEVGGPSS